MDRVRRYTLTLTASVLLMLIGSVLGAFGLDTIAMAVGNAGLILMTIAAWTHNRLGAPMAQDEQRRKIGARAVAHGWLLTFVAANLLFWLVHTRVVPLSAAEAVAILIGVMTVSIGVLPWAYKRQSHVH